MPDFFQTATINIAISIALGFVLILLSIIGFFTKRFVNEFTNGTIEVKELRKSITKLDGSLIGLVKDNESNKKDIENIKTDIKHDRKNHANFKRDVEGNFIGVKQDIAKLSNKLA